MAHSSSIFTQQPTLPRKGWYLEDIEDLKRPGEPLQTALCECCGIQEIRYVHNLAHPLVNKVIAVGSECAQNLCDPHIIQEADRRVRNFAVRRANFSNLANWRETSKGNARRLRKDGFVFFIKQGTYGGFTGAAKRDGSPGGWPFTTPYLKSREAAELAIFDAVYLPSLKGTAIARDLSMQEKSVATAAAARLAKSMSPAELSYIREIPFRRHPSRQAAQSL